MQYYRRNFRVLTRNLQALTIPSDLGREEEMNLKELNACAAVLFSDKVCTIGYSTMKYTDDNDAWDQTREDIFVKKISMFENWARVNGINE